MPQTHIGPPLQNTFLHTNTQKISKLLYPFPVLPKHLPICFSQESFLNKLSLFRFASLCFGHIFGCRLRSEVRRGADGRVKRETDVPFFAAFVACFPALAAAAYNFSGHPSKFWQAPGPTIGRTLTRLRSKTRTSAERLSCPRISPLSASAECSGGPCYASFH